MQILIITFKDLMFLFSCCTSHEGDYTYEIREDYKKVKNVQSASDLHQKINDSKQYVIKVKRSKLTQLINAKNKEKSKDVEFPPSKSSLGSLSNVSTCNWKRLSELVPHPTLFTTSKMKVQKTSQKSLAGDYFLNALSAIVEQPKRLKEIFVTQEISSNGIYVIRMRVNGQIQQIIVDDYVPVDELGDPLFMAPSHSQIWIPLLQKAWAKVNKSYANILVGNSAQVFKAFNFAPSQTIYIQEKQQKKQKLWKLLTDAVNRKSPVSCLTSHSEQIDWIHMNLIPNFQYYVLYAAQVFHGNTKSFRIVKLKNPNVQTHWQGNGSISNKQFWSNTVSSQQKLKLLDNFNVKNGQFLMLYSDFVKYFSQVYVSYQMQQGNFIWQEVFSNRKNGTFWQVEISHDGQYSFQLHQQSLRNKQDFDQDRQYGRSTMVLAKVNEERNYEYVCGAMRLCQQDVLVNTFLKQGKYVIYAKIQANKQNPLESSKSSLSCYSDKLCKFRLVEKKNYENFLQKTFLNYARNNKRQQYNKDKMWLSWKLLFKQCGFAYIAFGNAQDSNKKFSVKFLSKDFELMHFKLKSPYKAKNSPQGILFELEVLPGEEKIILARVINNKVTTLKFPPPIEMKIQDLSF